MKAYPWQVWTIYIPVRCRQRAIALLRKRGWHIDRDLAASLKAEGYLVNWFGILCAHDATDRGEIFAAFSEAVGG